MFVDGESTVRLRLIGDVHGHYRRYLELAKAVEYSVQLGDLGFDYKCMEELDPAKHKFIPGNHDNYERLPAHALTGYGLCALNGFQFFYIRGARSIDKQYRTPGVSWWPAEELTTAQGNDCVKTFAESRPQFVLSHDCPSTVYAYVLENPWFQVKNWTAQVLEQCRQLHHPKYWFFGHHHRTRWNEYIDGTRFYCLGELETKDFYEVPNGRTN